MEWEFDEERADDGECDACMCHIYSICTQSFGVGDECMSNGKSPGTAPLTLSYIIRNLL